MRNHSLVALGVGGLGVCALVLGFAVGHDYEPRRLVWGEHVFEVERSATITSVAYALRPPGGDVLFTISGSADHMCDFPVLLWLDIDQDGQRELYWEECSGPRTAYFDQVSGHFVERALSDEDTCSMAPGACTRWARVVRGGSDPFYTLGGLLLALGVVLGIGIRRPIPG